MDKCYINMRVNYLHIHILRTTCVHLKDKFHVWLCNKHYKEQLRTH